MRQPAAVSVQGVKKIFTRLAENVVFFVPGALTLGVVLNYGESGFNQSLRKQPGQFDK